MSCTRLVEGMAANAEQFVVPFAIAGLLVLLHAVDTRRRGLLAAAGALLGLGVLMKQHGAAFAVLAPAYLAWHAWRVRSPWKRRLVDQSLLGAGFLLPLLLTLAVLWASGVLDRFWFWTFEYALTYGSRISLGDGLVTLRVRAIQLLRWSGPLWVLGLGGLVALGLDPRLRRRRAFIALFLLLSALAVVPGFYFRRHYFVLTLPALSLLAGLSVSALAHALRNRHRFVHFAVPALVSVACLAFPVYSERDYLFRMDETEASRSAFGPNPFPEAVRVAEYIRERTAEGDRIAVFRSAIEVGQLNSACKSTSRMKARLDS